MSKWETQGRINLKMLSVEEDSLYLEIMFLRLPFCYIIASPCQPVEGEALREKILQIFKPQFQHDDDGCWQVPTGVSSLFTWEIQTSASEEPRASVTRNGAGPCRGCLPSSSQSSELQQSSRVHCIDGESSPFGRRPFMYYTKYTVTKSPYFSMF